MGNTGDRAVAAMQGFREAISIARRVKDNLPHVLLAGEGAERLQRRWDSRNKPICDGEIREARNSYEFRDDPKNFANLASSVELHQWVTLAQT
ncbi:MAG: hypothetical protein Ct9H300mP14_15510 [Gammaproteobacteria bacterium]|nr:MAG: hypothetical protein Ct9H300mP14_15510 [Gammaproteobacteria bacterium]